MGYETLFLLSLPVTVFLEFLILELYVVFSKKNISLKDVGITAFILSFATLPYIWFIFSQYGFFGYLSGEIFASVCEGIFLCYILKFSLRESMILSVGMNLFSWFVGKEFFSLIF